MLKYRYKEREVSVIICMLATLPFFQIISFDDYVMRVSIIPLLMMYVFSSPSSCKTSTESFW